MEVKIGVVYTGKEIVLDVDGDPEDVISQFDRALSESRPVLWITESKGRRVGVPLDKLAYVEVAPGDDSKRVGFGVG